MSELGQDETKIATQAQQADIFAALQQSSRRVRPTGQTLASFSGVTEVVESETNKYDLLCPRDGCGSIILKQGAARFIEKDSVIIDPSSLALPTSLSPLPEKPTLSPWWFVSPSPMIFENIGFSRPVESLPLSPSGVKLKLIACAECDLGPLGWCEEGGTDFFVACSRVKYRTE